MVLALDNWGKGVGRLFKEQAEHGPASQSLMNVLTRVRVLVLLA
jgi:hypothetical protein